MSPFASQRTVSWIAWNLWRAWVGPAPSQTAEEAVRQARPLSPLPRFVSSFQVLRKRRWNEQEVVIYHVSEYDLRLKRHAWLGFGVAQRTRDGWQRVANLAGEFSHAQRAGGMLLAHGRTISKLAPQPTILVGRVLSPPVAQVAVVFANNEVLEDATTDSIFFLTTANASAAEDLRLFDDDGNLLARLTYDNSLPKN